MQNKRIQEKEKCKHSRHTPQNYSIKELPPTHIHKMDDFGTLYLVHVQFSVVKMSQSGLLILMVTTTNMKLYMTQQDKTQDSQRST